MKYGVPTQKSIYTMGMAGKKPAVPVDYDSLKQKAKSKLSPEAYAYLAGGAGSETTMTANRSAFQEYVLKARMMRTTSDIDMRISLLGYSYNTPCLLYTSPSPRDGL